MFDKRAEKRAEALGIADRMRDLENDLLNIEGISEIDFDIDNFDEIPYVILIPRCKVPDGTGNWFRRRAAQLAQIVAVCEKHDLYNSGDRIEDYGEHWYIVRNCGIGWPRNGRI